MSYPIVMDSETSIKCPIGNNKAHPMWPANRVVKSGYYFVDGALGYASCDGELELEETEFVVGQNIKFDLLYCFRDNRHAPLPAIWDTQLAEYLLTGQQHKYASLGCDS